MTTPEAAALLAAFSDVGQPDRKGCWFQRLTDEQREAVVAAREMGHTFDTIAEVVTKWGQPIKRGTVGVHFAGEKCACAQ